MRSMAVSTALLLVGCAAAPTASPPRRQADQRPLEPAPAASADAIDTHEPPPASKRSPYDCPDAPPAPASSPSKIHDRIGGFYEDVVLDYLDAHGEYDQPVRKPSEEQADRAMCAALGKNGYSIFGEIQAGGATALPRSTDCVKREKQGLSIGRFSWEFSRLSSGKYLATRLPRLGWPHSPIAFDVTIATEEREGVVISIVSETGWRCPSDPEDPCDYFQNDKTGEWQALCLDKGRAACSNGGITSQVYVLDLSTERWLRFGEFHRRPAPEISVTAKDVTVRVGECVRSAKRPFGA